MNPKSTRRVAITLIGVILVAMAILQHGSPEKVILVISGALFWVLLIGLPVLFWRRIANLRERVTQLENEIRRIRTETH